MTQRFPEIFVIRHGQTEWNLQGRFQGRLNAPLTDKGHAQACDLGRMLTRHLVGRSDVSIFSSPQGRALDTARLAMQASGQGADIQIDDRLCEVSFGAWEGLDFDQIVAAWPKTAEVADRDPMGWHFTSPGGESLADLEARADSFLADLTGPAVLFTHGVLSQVLRARWLGVDRDEMRKLAQGQGVIFHLRPEADLTGRHVMYEK